MRVAICGLGAVGGEIFHMVAKDLAIRKDAKSEVFLVDRGTFTKQADEFHRRRGYKADLFHEEGNALYPDVKLVPVIRYVGTESDEYTIAAGELMGSVNIVLSGVDNHKSRKLLSDAAQQVGNATLIVGGNDGGHDGLVQVYLRRNGYDITPPLTANHPYIANPTDESPLDRLYASLDHCPEHISSGSQMFSTALLCAAYMMAAYHAVLELERKSMIEEFPYTDVYFNALSGKTRPCNYPVIQAR